MDFRITTEQQLLRDSLTAFLRDHDRDGQRRAAARSAVGWRPELWQRLASELGVVGAALPERVGGSGGGPVEQLIVMQALGAVFANEPMLETAVVAGGLLARAGGASADELLRGLVEGTRIVVLASAEAGARQDLQQVASRAVRTGKGWRLDGHKCMVSAAPWATQLLVSARTAGADRDPEGISLFRVDADAAGVTMQVCPTIDDRRVADIRFDAVMLPADALIGVQDAALPELERARDDAIAAVAAEASGLLRRLHGDTVAHCRQRRQFGQAIGSFQVVQHRLVDMLLQVELAESASLLAALSLDAEPRQRALATSAAKIAIGRACRQVSQGSVQLHGAMGMTDELTIGDGFKRAIVIEQEYGTVDWHLRRHASLERQLEYPLERDVA